LLARGLLFLGHNYAGAVLAAPYPIAANAAARGEVSRGVMGSVKCVVAACAAALLVSALALGSACADEGFPFGMEMTLDALPQPGSKRVPDLDIGDNGEVVLELWCKGGKGQFSVAGSSIIFIAGALQDRNCPQARADADDELVAALSATTNWKRQGDSVFFIGPKTLRFRLNTN
jgi:hypothetical protein